MRQSLWQSWTLKGTRESPLSGTQTSWRDTEIMTAGTWVQNTLRAWVLLKWLDTPQQTTKSLKGYLHGWWGLKGRVEQQGRKCYVISFMQNQSCKHACVYACMCGVCEYIHMHVFVGYVQVGMYVFASVCVCMCLCMHVCMCVYCDMKVERRLFKENRSM